MSKSLTAPTLTADEFRVLPSSRPLAFEVVCLVFSDACHCQTCYPGNQTWLDVFAPAFLFPLLLLFLPSWAEGSPSPSERGSAQGFFMLKESFFLPAVTAKGSGTKGTNSSSLKRPGIVTYRSAKTCLIIILDAIRQERTCRLLFKSVLLFLHLNPFMFIISPEQIKSLIRHCTLTAVLKYLVLDKRHVIVHYMKYHSALSYLSCFIDFLYSNNNTSNPISISSFPCTEVWEVHDLSVKANKDLIVQEQIMHLPQIIYKFNTNFTPELGDIQVAMF